MKVGTETIEYIAKLAKLGFDQAETEKFAEEFEHILTHFDNLDKEDLTEIIVNDFDDIGFVLREDRVKQYENKGELFQNVKEMKESHIVIPKVIE